MRTSVKGQARLMLRLKVYHIYQTGRLRKLGTSKLVRRSSIRYQLPRSAIKGYKVRFLHASGGIPCWPQPAVTQLVSRRHANSPT